MPVASAAPSSVSFAAASASVHCATDVSSEGGSTVNDVAGKIDKPRETGVHATVNLKVPTGSIGLVSSKDSDEGPDFSADNKDDRNGKASLSVIAASGPAATAARFSTFTGERTQPRSALEISNKPADQPLPAASASTDIKVDASEDAKSEVVAASTITPLAVYVPGAQTPRTNIKSLKTHKSGGAYDYLSPRENHLNRTKKYQTAHFSLTHVIETALSNQTDDQGARNMPPTETKVNQKFAEANSSEGTVPASTSASTGAGSSAGSTKTILLSPTTAPTASATSSQVLVSTSEVKSHVLDKPVSSISPQRVALISVALLVVGAATAYLWNQNGSKGDVGSANIF